MAPDATHGPSIEQLISALDRKLLMECGQIQSVMPPTSRALVATLAKKVPSQKLKGSPRALTRCLQVDILERHAQEVIREVRTLRNSLRPVNRLPPEVLTFCATLVSDGDPRSIVALTHVCRYWREAIGSNPRNWRSISTSWKRLVPLCLERAGAVPLVVDIAVPDGKGDEKFLKALIPNIPRTGSLRLTGYSSVEAVADDLPGFFDSPILNLVSLELQQSVAPAQPFPSNEMPTPPVFSNVRTLKSLHLTQTPIYPALFNIASLVELKLIGYTSPFEFGTFIGFLDSHIALEFVDLDIQFTDGSVWTTPARKVALARLRHLSITCSESTDSKGLLSCVSLPRGVRLEVFSTKRRDCPGLSSFLPSPLNPIQELLNPITTVKSQFTPPVLHLTGKNSFFSFTALAGWGEVYPGITLFSITAVREFHLDIHPCTSTNNNLSWVLKRLPALETLVISETRIPPEVLSVLAAEPVLCPFLKTVAFFNCDMAEDVIKELGDVIAKRRDSLATRLYRVVIVNSTATPPNLKVIQQLRKSVPCVEVRVDDKLPDLS